MTDIEVTQKLFLKQKIMLFDNIKINDSREWIYEMELKYNRSSSLALQVVKLSLTWMSPEWNRDLVRFTTLSGHPLQCSISPLSAIEFSNHMLEVEINVNTTRWSSCNRNPESHYDETTPFIFRVWDPQLWAVRITLIWKINYSGH